MSTATRLAILKAKVEGVIVDLLVKTNAENVEMGNGKTLAQFMTDYLTETQVDARIQSLVGAAPAALDTLKEIATALDNDPDFAGTMTTLLADKVSFSDLTDALNNIDEYIHPSTHSADMITETSSKQFVTAAQKAKLDSTGRILTGENPPGDMTENDLFFQIIPEEEE